MMDMAKSRFRFTISALLIFVACIALNIWLFRLGALWGILGLNVTKHVVIALLCQNLGVDRADAPKSPQPQRLSPPSPSQPLPLT
ncbi:MAG: hypothetical protein P4L85_02610 [Paludisphaera borealis]|uniref:hypothetical protein n=1 Tax=Paludisphaera borealis TaxID=1387353 RepID=UPI002851EFE1|nr:hypothetical protein [Paludisphaera borealis]MDR3618215.1 hypothetical protein [Paludisphaera borealis]